MAFEGLSKKEAALIWMLQTGLDVNDSAKINSVYAKIKEKDMFSSDFAKLYEEELTRLKDGSALNHECISCGTPLSDGEFAICSDCIKKIAAYAKDGIDGEPVEHESAGSFEKTVPQPVAEKLDSEASSVEISTGETVSEALFEESYPESPEGEVISEDLQEEHEPEDGTESESAYDEALPGLDKLEPEPIVESLEAEALPSLEEPEPEPIMENLEIEALPSLEESELEAIMESLEVETLPEESPVESLPEEHPVETLPEEPAMESLTKEQASEILLEESKLKSSVAESNTKNSGQPPADEPIAKSLSQQPAAESDRKPKTISIAYEGGKEKFKEKYILKERSKEREKANSERLSKNKQQKTVTKLLIIISAILLVCVVVLSIAFLRISLKTSSALNDIIQNMPQNITEAANSGASVDNRMDDSGMLNTFAAYAQIQGYTLMPGEIAEEGSVVYEVSPLDDYLILFYDGNDNQTGVALQMVDNSENAQVEQLTLMSFLLASVYDDLSLSQAGEFLENDIISGDMVVRGNYSWNLAKLEDKVVLMGIDIRYMDE